MELNREQIIKALECCVKAKSHGDCRTLNCPALMNDECIYIGETDEDCNRQQFADALLLIKEQEQKIFELETRLKECENGYEGTLFLDRCKLHDAEEKVKELTAENESLAKSVNEASELIRKLKADKKELTEENERLRASQIVQHIHIDEQFRKECEYEMKQIKADTVRKAIERIKEDAVSVSLLSNPPKFMLEIREDALDQIAKEISEEG